ncbi:MAG: sulfatase family protein [Verrucomicrobiota bacterium]
MNTARRWIRIFIQFLALGVELLLVAAANPVSQIHPNVIVILADDMGIGDVSGLNPKSAWQTPAIDRLMREGRTFSDAHSASGVCSPSRYTLLTGRYSWRGRLKSGVLQGYDPSLIETNRLTLPAFLRQQGYATAMVGKWHLGLDWVRTGTKVDAVDFAKPFAGGPTAHGFDRFFGIGASLDMPPYVYLRQDRSTTVPTERVASSPGMRMWREGWIGPDFRHEDVHPRFRQEALDWIRERAHPVDRKPFFLYLALASPHTPILPTEGFAGRTHTTAYGDFVAQVDATVGDLLGALDREGIATNTIVVFTTDNGFAPVADMAALRRLGHDPTGGYRGHKADLFEGGHRVPFIVRWPGRIAPGSQCTRTVGHVDLIATFADLLHVPLPSDAAEDSLSLLPQLLKGDSGRGGRESLVHQSSNGSFAIRQGRWKLLFSPDSGGWSIPKPGSPEAKLLPPLQLYDLESDPTESVNVWQEHPKEVDRLGRRMASLVATGRTTPGPSQPIHWPAEWIQLRPLDPWGASRDTRQRVMDAAVRAAVERGWRAAETVVGEPVLGNGQWEIWLQRKPLTPGGHATVTLSGDGKVLRFRGGK